MKPVPTRDPTLAEIDILTSFLPILTAQGFAPIEEWYGGKQADGSITLPYPKYAPQVEEFFLIAAAEQWCDYGYNPENALRMINEQIFIQSASLSEIKSMLTFCVRGERFSDGHRGAMIENGTVRRILERLIAIRTERNDLP